MTVKIHLDTSPPLAEIILNQPEKRNALSQNMWAAIPTLIAQADADPEVKVLLIHGGETGVFAAGADISEFETTYASPQSAKASGETIAAALDAVENCSKPVIAAIEGACVGGGVSLAMACDIRVAADSAKFGVTPGKLGLVYPAGDTKRLLDAIGPSATKNILFTGKIFNADEAARISLIDHMVADGAAILEAHKLAEQIASISQWSTRAIKRMIKGLQSGWPTDHPDAEALFLEGFANEDFEDGYKAFLEKRPANFTFK